MYNGVCVKFFANPTKSYTYALPQETLKDLTNHIALIKSPKNDIVAVLIIKCIYIENIHNETRIKPIIEVCNTKLIKGGGI